MTVKRNVLAAFAVLPVVAGLIQWRVEAATQEANLQRRLQMRRMQDFHRSAVWRGERILATELLNGAKPPVGSAQEVQVAACRFVLKSLSPMVTTQFGPTITLHGSMVSGTGTSDGTTRVTGSLTILHRSSRRPDIKIPIGWEAEMDWDGPRETWTLRRLTTVELGETRSPDIITASEVD